MPQPCMHSLAIVSTVGDLLVQFFKDKGIKVVTVYPPATYTTMTTDRDDMEPVPEKEAQPSDVAKDAILVCTES